MTESDLYKVGQSSANFSSFNDPDSEAELIRLAEAGDIWCRLVSMQHLTLFDVGGRLSSQTQQRFYQILHQWKNAESVLDLPNPSEHWNLETFSIIKAMLGVMLRDLNYSKRVRVECERIRKLLPPKRNR